MEATSMSLLSDPELPPRQSPPRPDRPLGPDSEPTTPVQLISQTSHLALSNSRTDAESLNAGEASPYRMPDHGDPRTPLMFAISAAQPCPEIEHALVWPLRERPRCSRQWEESIKTAMGMPAPVAGSNVVGCWQACGNYHQAIACSLPIVPHHVVVRKLSDLPTEVLLQILGYLDVSDLLATSRTSHYLRILALAPILHHLRLRRTRAMLPPMLASPSRPSLADLIRRSIFLTNTTVVSRRLARKFVAHRLQRRLAARPSAEALVERCVLPPECIPGKGIDGSSMVAPALVARKRAVERQRVKDSLRKWVGSVWRGEVQHREEGIKRWEERVGVGRVWRLRRYWERLGTSSVNGDRER